MASRAASAKIRQNSDAPSSAALLVLAGISASDAAGCKALGRRSRGEDHHDAEALLELVDPGGTDAADAMQRLVNLKDEAHYGFYNVSAKDLKSAFTQAGKLVRFARSVLARP